MPKMHIPRIFERKLQSLLRTRAENGGVILKIYDYWAIVY